MIGLISLQYSIGAMRKSLTALICLLLVAITLAGCMERLVASESHEPASRSMYRATDTSSSPTDDSDDVLISIRWIEAHEDLHWDSITMKLEVDDSVYDCTVTGSDCLISQDGSDDNLWQTNEFLTLIENGVDIVSSSGTNVEIHIFYHGDQISGTSEVLVQ